jgi:enoyl-CoA hydratase/carnithine racemase
MGLIHRVTPVDRLLAETTEFLKPILKNPQYALSQAKRAVRASQNRSPAEGLSIETEMFKKCFSNEYFVNLMCEQIKTGKLQTTAELPTWVCEERR